jgi:hypothetical protein
LATNLSTLSNILKEYYLGPVAEQLNNEVLLLSRLESKTEDLVGRRAYVPLHWGRSGGVGARAESAALPSAGNQQYEKAVYDLKYLYGRVEVTGPSMAKTKNEAGAFLQALKSELDGIRNDLRKDLARQVYGDGTAKIATATAVTGTSGSTMTVGSEVVRKGQVYPGMVVNVYSSGGTAYTAASGQAGGPAWPTVDVLNTTKAFVISAVDITAGTVTLNVPSATFAIGDYLVRAGVASYAANTNDALNIPATAGTYSLSDEVDGLQRIVSDSATAFGGITPTGSAFWWDNQRIALGSVTDQRQNSADPKGITGAVSSGTDGYQNLTFGAVQQGLNKARIAGGMPSSIVTSFGVQREFYTLFTTQVQYIDPKTLDYAQGFKTLSYNGMPVIADIEAPYGKMYILDESTLKVYSDQDWHFLDADGLTLRQVTGYDKFEAIMARYMNLGATRRNNQVVITGIKVDGAADAGY